MQPNIEQAKYGFQRQFIKSRGLPNDTFEELKLSFPDARIARVDSDSMAGGDYYRLLGDFADGVVGNGDKVDTL